MSPVATLATVELEVEVVRPAELGVTTSFVVAESFLPNDNSSKSTCNSRPTWLFELLG